MNFSVAIPEPLQRSAIGHLLRSDGQEDVCFALWVPSTGATRQSSIVVELILPEEGERQIHGNASFGPEFVQRAIGLALERQCGLGLMHSHPFPGWQGMSDDDIATERGIAPSAFGATGLPLVGMTIGSDAVWSSRSWQRVGPGQYTRQEAESVRRIRESGGSELVYDLSPTTSPAAKADHRVGEDRQRLGCKDPSRYRSHPDWHSWRG
jgi:molybdopterin-synthase adenylyltransferase